MGIAGSFYLLSIVPLSSLIPLDKKSQTHEGEKLSKIDDLIDSPERVLSDEKALSALIGFAILSAMIISAVYGYHRYNFLMSANSVEICAVNNCYIGKYFGRTATGILIKIEPEQVMTLYAYDIGPVVRAE